VTPLVGRCYGAGQFTDRDLCGILGEIVIGQKPGRENAKEKIFFNPLGLSICDLLEGFRIYQSAKEKGMGKILPLWQTPLWV